MAKKTKCLPCISKDIKQLIRDNYRDPVLNEALSVVEDCPVPGEINFCSVKKRAPSVYQTFIKECLSTKPIKGKPFGEAAKYMKECAVEYRKHHPKT